MLEHAANAGSGAALPDAAGCAGAPGELDVAAMTAMAGMHHSTVRSHLAKLRDAGLISERTAPPVGRGRPKLLYRWVPPAPAH